MAARVLHRDQRRELQRFHQRKAADLAGCRLGDQKVSALDGAAGHCSRMALRRL